MASIFRVRRVRIGASFAAAALALGCSDPVYCDICTTSAIAYGTVRDADGQPIEGVPVEIVAYLETCDIHSRGDAIGQTGASGYFRARMISIFSPFTARCFIVRVNPFDDERWPTGVAELSTLVEFRSDYDGSRRDSVRLDVMLEE